MGDLRNDDKTLIFKRLKDLISANEFKSNIESFCDKINTRYTKRKVKDELNIFLKLNNIKVNL